MDFKIIIILLLVATYSCKGEFDAEVKAPEQDEKNTTETQKSLPPFTGTINRDSFKIEGQGSSAEAFKASCDKQEDLGSECDLGGGNVGTCTIYNEELGKSVVNPPVTLPRGKSLVCVPK